MTPNEDSFLKAHLEDRDFQILPLAGDASSRRYFRVVQEPQTYVLMCWDPFTDETNYPFLSVQRHFSKFDIHVPEVRAVASNDGLILLEDLGDLTLERKFWENQDQTLSWPHYELSLDELIKIHFAASKDRSAPCSAFQIAFDTEKFLWEMNYGREHLIEKLAHVKLSDADQGRLQKIFLDICQILDQEPKCISHRDYHSRNVMVKFGKVRVIDFQDARLGPIQYDLVSLLQDSYVQLSQESRQHLLDIYLEKASEFLPAGFSRNHFDHIYRLQLIQRCFKACGSFASFYNLRSDKRYLKYLPSTIRAVSNQLREFKEFRFFLDVLESNGLTERSFET